MTDSLNRSMAKLVLPYKGHIRISRPQKAAKAWRFRIPASTQVDFNCWKAYTSFQGLVNHIDSTAGMSFQDSQHQIIKDCMSMVIDDKSLNIISVESCKNTVE